MKRFASLVLALIMICSLSVTAFAQTPEPATGGTSASADENMYTGITPRTAQAKPFTIPGGQGTLTSNAWRQTNETTSGNTLQWDYQVSAVYSGSKTVESIRTSWYGGASLKNSASISLGVNASGATVSAREPLI